MEHMSRIMCLRVSAIRRMKNAHPERLETCFYPSFQGNIINVNHLNGDYYMIVNMINLCIVLHRVYGVYQVSKHLPG